MHENACRQPVALQLATVSCASPPAAFVSVLDTRTRGPSESWGVRERREIRAVNSPAGGRAREKRAVSCELPLKPVAFVAASGFLGVRASSVKARLTVKIARVLHTRSAKSLWFSVRSAKCATQVDVNALHKAEGGWSFNRRIFM